MCRFAGGHVLGDLPPQAGELHPRAGRAEVEFEGRRRLASAARPRAAAGGHERAARSSSRMRPAGPLPRTRAEVDAELAGEQPHRRGRRGVVPAEASAGTADRGRSQPFRGSRSDIRRVRRAGPASEPGLGAARPAPRPVA